MIGAQQAQLAELVSWAEQSKDQDVAARSHPPDRHVAVDDDMQSVAQVALVEDDLGRREHPTAGTGEEPFSLALGNRGQNRVLHPFSTRPQRTPRQYPNVLNP
jgi:hypothetical protein